MEEWQKNHITQNLPRLMNSTEFNSIVKAELLANNILTQNDVEDLDAESSRKGKATASFNYYQCLMTRVGAYKLLTEILDENKQTGAARILKDGLRNLGIPKILDGFNDMEIDVQGKLLKIHELFPPEKLELAHRIFRDTISEQELYDLFVIKQKTFVLAHSNVPPQPPLYIPRFLSNRIEIDKSVFKADCPDVFVFKNNVRRLQLTEIAKPNLTATSSTQLRNITARFISLDAYEDWIEMKKSAKVPTHLISYDNDQKVYTLEDSSATLDILSKIGSKNQRAYMSEDEFVQQQLSNDLKESSVCICDTPGMGKTFLLANIARIISKHCTGTIFAFIQLSIFVQEFPLSPKNGTVDQETALLNVLKYVSASLENAESLSKLVKAELLRVELFFDGFDEIPLNKVELTKQVFLSIKSNLRNVRIYITSRPHMRHELEKSLGVIAYDILPFNLQNQVDYLVRFWSPNVPNLHQTELSNYALKCLKEINKKLTRNDKAMAGIPLLCRLIAEVYRNKIHFYLTTKTQNIDVPFKIAAMYQAFIEQRFKAATTTEEEIKTIELVHIWNALQLLFPADGFHNDEIFKPVNQMMATSALFKAGIIQPQSNTQLEFFLSRTFAEYFAANYFLGKLQSTVLKPRTFVRNFFNLNDDPEKLLSSIFNLLMTTSDEHYIFVHSVILSFVDFNLNEVKISEEIMCRLASLCASLSRKNFLSILCSCCNHNFYNLFSLLKEALTKWNWFLKKMFFTTGNCYELLSVCIRQSTSQMFHSCIQLFTEVLRLDMEKISIHHKDHTLLEKAAGFANYEAVEYLLDVSIEQTTTVEYCVICMVRENDLEMLKRRECILHLFHNKKPTLITKAPNILFIGKINLSFFKKLVELGANLNAIKYDLSALNYLNCVMSAASYMSPTDYHELVQFLLTECKAEFLFLPNEKWKDPLPYIIRWASLLPETLELLLNIPGIDINMKDEDGENLLFSAVGGLIVGNLQQLVDRGLDYNARGMENRSLLHVAVGCGGVEMVRYLFSLKLDPNSRDQTEWTPLHYAAEYTNMLSVVEVLVENGANILAKTIKGQTAPHLSAANIYDLKTKVIKYLIGKGAGVNDRDNDGNTPLHLCEDKRISDCLIEMGADIHAKNKMGETPAQMNSRFWEWSN